MRKQLQKYLIHAFVIVQITLVCMITLNNALFIHRHILPNGDVITHAHPYKKSGDTAPFKTHTHTTAEFFLLSGLNNLVFSIAAVFAVLLTFQIVKYNLQRNPHIIVPFHSFSSGRAPPVSL